VNGLAPMHGNAPLPTVYQDAVKALANCDHVDECKDWADKAAALASYARQADDESMLRTAMRIRARAIRRMGEVLEEIEPANGARTDLEPGRDTHTRLQAAEDAGISRNQAIDALRVARVPAADFEREIESDRPATITKLAAMGTRPTRPLIDLQGRDPNEFNRALHFVARFRDYRGSLRAIEIGLAMALADLDDQERAELAEIITEIDTRHGRILGAL
jgi:hypothetical protein